MNTCETCKWWKVCFVLRSWGLCVRWKNLRILPLRQKANIGGTFWCSKEFGCVCHEERQP